MISYYRSIVTMALSCIISHIVRYCSKIRKFIYTALSSTPVGGNLVGISQRCLVLEKLQWSSYHTVKKVLRYVKQFWYLLLLVCVSWTILVSHKAASSSAECSRDKPPFSFVRGQDSTMWDIVWVSPQGHRSVSVSRNFLLQAPQCPCSVRKWFSRDHCCRGRSKPGCRIVGSQGKLCDLYLSALSVRYYNTGAIYTHLPLVCVKMLILQW